MPHLFTYGTLMFPEVWERVVGRRGSAAAMATQWATLFGYTAYRVRDDVYPVLVAAQPDDSTCGRIYFDVDAETLALLDAYETEFYVRTEVGPQLVEADGTQMPGQIVPCEAYLLPATEHRWATNEPWNAERFAATEMESYLRRLR